MVNQTIGHYTYSEIISQGKTWGKTLQSAMAQLEQVSPWLQLPHGEVIFTGCGSTHFLSLSSARHWVELTNTLARGIPSSELWLYPSSTFSGVEPLLVAVSRSGETTETINAIKTYKAQFNQEPLIISCYPESCMVKDSYFSLISSEAHEVSVAQTRSFSSMFILSQALAGYAANNQAYLAELNCLPSRADVLIEKYEPLVKTIAEDINLNHFVFLGSGLYYGLAHEVMLKLKEMSISVTEASNFMEFRHGPMSMVTNRTLVIGLLSDRCKSSENKVLQDMKGLGATTMALAEDGNGIDADYVIELESGISELARGALFLPLLQLLSYYHALEKGLDPDQPTNLKAVVHL